MEVRKSRVYRLALYSVHLRENERESKKIMEQMFDASCYYDVGVDIKHLANSFISDYVNVLSLPKKELTLKYGDVNLPPKDVQTKTKKAYFKYVLYIDNDYIMERNFFVENFNNVSIYSIELKECFDNIISKIQRYLKMKDIALLEKQFQKMEWDSQIALIENTPVGSVHLNK